MVRAVLLALAGPSRAGDDGGELASLLARHFAARGGLAAIHAVTSVRAHGKRMDVHGDLPFLWEWKRPNRIRIELESPDGRVVQGYDGERAWMLLPGETEPRFLRPELVTRFDQEADFDGPLVDAAPKQNRLTLVGATRLDGVAAWDIEVDLPDGDRQHVYLDAASLLEMRRSTHIEVPGRAVEVDVDYGGYRATGGLVLAHRVVTRAHGETRETAMVFDSIELDAPLADTLFAPPAPPAPAAP